MLYTDADYKLFRKRLPGWQENYMARLLEQYKAIIGEDALASERFHKLEQEVKKHRRDVGVCCEVRNSRMFGQHPLADPGRCHHPGRPGRVQ